MSARGREGLSKIFGSTEYMTWASRVGNVIDARKLASEFSGVRKNTCGAPYAQGLQTLCRENPPLVTVPLPTEIPAPFNGRGMVLLEPRGGTEDIAALKAAGFTYVMLNLAYVSGGDWSTHRSRCAQHGVEVVPWMTCREPQDSIRIEEKADQWGSRAAVHELEHAHQYTPAQLAQTIHDIGRIRVRAVMTLPWAQNGAGWAALRDWVAMPEAYLNANPAYTPEVVTQHTVDEGMPKSLPLFGWGVWSDAPTYVSPATYLAQWPGRPYAVYAGDGREPQYREWLR